MYCTLWNNFPTKRLPSGRRCHRNLICVHQSNLQTPSKCHFPSKSPSRYHTLLPMSHAGYDSSRAVYWSHLETISPCLFNYSFLYASRIVFLTDNDSRFWAKPRSRQPSENTLTLSLCVQKLRARLTICAHTCRYRVANRNQFDVPLEVVFPFSIGQHIWTAKVSMADTLNPTTK